MGFKYDFHENVFNDMNMFSTKDYLSKMITYEN